MLVKTLAAQDYEEAAGCVRSDVADVDRGALRSRHGAVLRATRTHARGCARTPIAVDDHRRGRPQVFRVRQILLDPQDDNTWYLEGRVDLSDRDEAEGPLLELLHIGS